MSDGVVEIFPPSPLDCAVCNHSFPASCAGCGGLNGSAGWGPCSFCRGKIGCTIVVVFTPAVDGASGVLLV